MPLHQIKERLKEYFTFTRKERNGILVLLALLLFMQGAIIYTHFLKPPGINIELKDFQNELAEFENSLESNNLELTVRSDSASGINSTIKNFAHEINYFSFDPNTITAQQWKGLGMDDRTIKSISNYLLKGGKFYRKDDLKKIYTLKKEEYERLEPYIVIAASRDTEKANEKKKFGEPLKRAIVELNAATKEDLMTLPMIGEKRAEQILKYRQLLGGFISREQLKEVYSIPDSVYQSFVSYVDINTSLIKKININTDSISHLKHFYIKKPVAQMIVNYRLQHGDYHSPEELHKLPLITDSIFNKISGYLITE